MSYYMLNGLGAELCGMHGMKGMHGACGFGASADCNTLNYKTNKGVEGQGQLCPTGQNCGNPFALQQALNDLGFGPIDVDGAVGPQTYAAIAKAMATYGVSYTSGAPSALVCQTISDAWNAKYYGPAPTTSTNTGTTTASTAAVRGTLIKRTPVLVSAIRQMTTGTATTKEGELPTDAGVVDKTKAWWGGLGTPAKVGVVAGGVAVLGLLAYALTKPGRQVEMQVMKANRCH